MKISTITVLCLWAILPAVQISAQPPIYHFAPEYEITVAPDTLRQYFLFNVNQDSVPDLILATLDSIWVLDGTNGTALIDPIPTYRRGFVFTPYRDSTNNIILYFAYADSFTYYQIIFRIISFPLFSPSERDSILVAASKPFLEMPQFQGLTYLLPFDIGNDDEGEFLIFFNYYSYMATIGSYYTGYDIVFDDDGNLIRDTTERHRLINISAFKLNDAPAFSIMDYSAFYSYWGGDYINFRLETFNDSLLRVDIDTLSGGNFKHLKDQADSLLMMMQFFGGEVTAYDNPFLDGGISHNFPCAAIPSFFHIGDSPFLIAGCPNSYFELRDLQMNLMAFIWGPNITISEAEAIDIDLDGTDELLCRTATGFVLHRLDTTAVGVAFNDAPLPDRPSLYAYPNPFNSRVTISLTGFDDPAEIAIYDIGGRLVARLEASNGQAIWDGMVEDGADAQSGLYLVRAENNRQNITAKIIMLR